MKVAALRKAAAKAPAMVDARRLLNLLATTGLGERAAEQAAEDAPAPAADGPAETAPSQRPEPPSAPAHKTNPATQAALWEILGAKVLQSHLQNQYQLLEHAPSDFRNLERAEAQLLVRAMIVAAHADGDLDRGEEQRIRDAIAPLEMEADEMQALADQLHDPPPLNPLLRQVQDPQTAARFYAAALLAADKSREVNRLFLRYLAARLALPAKTVHAFNRRFRLLR